MEKHVCRDCEEQVLERSLKAAIESKDKTLEKYYREQLEELKRQSD